MSDADGLTKDLTSSKIKSQSDNTASYSNDAEATIDPPDSQVTQAFQAERSAPEPKTIGPYRLIRKLGQGGMTVG